MILSSFYYEVLQECCPVKTSQEHDSSLAFFGKKKAQLPAIRITEQALPLTKRKIKTDSVQSSSNTCKNFSLKIYSQHGNFLNAI